MSVLLVESSDGAAEYVESALAGQTGGVFRLHRVAVLTDAQDWLDDHDYPDLVLLNAALPDAPGLVGLDRIKQRHPAITLVLLGAKVKQEFATEAIARGAADMIDGNAVPAWRLKALIAAAVTLGRATKQATDLERRLENLRLAHDVTATLDPSSGMLNELGLRQAHDRIIARVRRGGLGAHAVLVAQLNKDQLRRRYGQVIANMATGQARAAIENAVRGTDAAGRLETDELLVLLPGTRLPEAFEIARRLSAGIASIDLGQGRKGGGIEAAVAVVPLTLTTPFSERVDRLRAICRRRDKGTSTVRLWSGTHDSCDLTATIKSLRSGHGFQAIRQAIVDLKTREPIGYEFFARTVHPGAETPERFLTAALEAGIADVVDVHCLAATLRQCASLDPEITGHINVLPATIMRVPPDRLIGLLRRAQSSQTGQIARHKNRKLCIEISEKHLPNDVGPVVGALKPIREAGIRIALDDSRLTLPSVEHIVRLRPDVVKIDASMVLGMAHDAAMRHAVKRLRAIARTVGATTIAEGVETDEDLEAVVRCGISAAQGHRFGSPA